MFVCRQLLMCVECSTVWPHVISIWDTTWLYSFFCALGALALTPTSLAYALHPSSLPLCSIQGLLVPLGARQVWTRRRRLSWTASRTEQSLPSSLPTSAPPAYMCCLWLSSQPRYRGGRSERWEGRIGGGYSMQCAYIECMVGRSMGSIEDQGTILRCEVLRRTCILCCRRCVVSFHTAGTDTTVCTVHWQCQLYI